MNNAHGFLQEILARPETDAPRLIYADWLEEQGDPRGEFIQIQCARAALPWFHPDDHALRLREQALWNQHGACWLKELPGLPGLSWFFERGFAARVSVHWGTLQAYGERFFQVAPISGAQMLTREPTAWNGLRDWPFRERLRSLDLNGMRIGLVGLSEMVANPGFQGLTSLELPAAGVGGATPSTNVSGLPQLRRLSLARNQLDVESLLALGSGLRCPGLESLAVDVNPLGPDGLSRIATAPWASRLRQLSANECQLQSESFAALAGAKLTLDWRALSLGNNDLSGASLQHLAATHLPLLAALTLRFANLHSSDIAHLAAAPFAGQIVWLDLMGNDLGADGFRALADSPLRSSVSYLSLALTRPSQVVQAMRYLTDYPWPALRSLNLSQNAFGSREAAALATAPGLGGLLELRLNQNPLGDYGAAALAHSETLTQLMHLELQRCQVRDMGAKALCRSPTLTRLTGLDLNENQLSPPVQRLMRSRFPPNSAWSGARSN